MPHVALTKQLVLQHCAERRRDRHGQLEAHTFIDQALHHAQQWDVTLSHRFEEPVFFEEMLMFRMTNEWKMRVENEREVSRHRKTFNVSFRAKRGNSQQNVRAPTQPPRLRQSCAPPFPDASIPKTTIPSSLAPKAIASGMTDLQCPAKVLEAVEALFDNVDTGGVTEPNRAIITEGSSRDDRDVGFT